MHPPISIDAPRAAATIMGSSLPRQDLLNRRMGHNRNTPSAGPPSIHGLRFRAERAGTVMVSRDVTAPLDGTTDCGEKLPVAPAGSPEMLSATAVGNPEPVGAIVTV